MSIEAIAIYPDKRIVTVSLGGLDDYQAIVGGYIEPINLDFGTMFVNEEYSYFFDAGDVNWIAGDVCGLGGRPEFMLFQPILGPVIVTGGVDEEGETLPITERGRNAVRRVGREAGGQFEQQKGDEQ